MAAKTKKKQPGRSARTHAGWRGSLAFGLVTFPVEAFNAVDPARGDIHFHQIHAACHSRIRYQKTCPIHGAVPNDEIVSGYEYQKGKYVELEPSELEALRSESDRALRVEAFVKPDAIDPIYLDGRMYYVLPSEPVSHEPYAVVVEAMQRENRIGVAHLIFSGKDQMVLIRPLEGILHMAMLRFEAEVRPPKSVAAALPKPANIARQLHLAQTLVKEWSQDQFDFSKYENSHRQKVKEVIEAKVRGHEIVAPAKEKPQKVLNLMDALEQSLKHAPAGPAHPTRKRHAKRRSA